MPPQAHAFAPAQGISSGSERPPGLHAQHVPVQAVAIAAPAVGGSAGPAAHNLLAAWQHTVAHGQHLSVQATTSPAPAQGSSADPAAHAPIAAGQPSGARPPADPLQPAQTPPVSSPAVSPLQGAASLCQSRTHIESAHPEHTAPVPSAQHAQHASRHDFAPAGAQAQVEGKLEAGQPAAGAAGQEKQA